MKLKNLSISTVLIIVALSLIILPLKANASVDCAVAKISRIGMYPGAFGTKGIMVQLIDQAPTPSWPGARTFYLSDTVGNEGYAALLTAYSMGKTLWVRIAGDASPGSLIIILHIND